MPKGRFSMLTVTITMAEEVVLAAILRRRVAPIAYVRRAHCILLRSQGLPIATVAARVGLSRRHTYKWLRRWNTEGLAGLQDRPRTGDTGGPA